jgi:3-keto-5-aminohexanoate cleavage enzyme
MELPMEADKLLITVAPCIPPYMAKDLPGLDLSPQGIAAEVIRACNAGANIAHLHVWDAGGKPTTNVEAFEETVRLIRARCDIIIEGSTGGFNDLTPSERSVSLQADIELASLNPGSVNYDQGVYINSPADIHYWASAMHSRAIKPDIAIFEAGMITNSLLLGREGLIETPYLFTFVLGQQGALPATPKNLLFMTESVPVGSLCFVARHSGWDIQLTVMNMSIGGHARAGFEDTPYYTGGELATSNAQLIDRIVRIAGELGREPATPHEARRALGIQQTPA